VNGRPILMSAPMVCALMEGTKTQDRRALKLQPSGAPSFGLSPMPNASGRPVFYAGWDGPAADGSTCCICPYGVPGGRLWVRDAGLTLEITAVRVEKLQVISRGDAMAEGCPFPNMAQGRDPREWYAGLYDATHGPGAWEANPWVWVVDFRRLTHPH
jgi:hypothetical protein